MKGIATLIRLHRLRLTQQQRELIALQATANGLRADIDALAQAARDEAGVAAESPEAGHTLGAFVQASIARRRALAGSLAAVEREMAGIRDRVAAAFRELKRYELIEAQRREAARREASRRERGIENEVGLSMHRRKKQAAGG